MDADLRTAGGVSCVNFRPVSAKSTLRMLAKGTLDVEIQRLRIPYRHAKHCLCAFYDLLLKIANARESRMKILEVLVIA